MKLCERRGEKKKCTGVKQKSIDAKVAKKIVEKGGIVGEFAPGEDASPEASEVLPPPACEPDEKNPNLVRCGASIGGPAGGDWIFEKTPSGVRLAEVWDWAEDS